MKQKSREGNIMKFRNIFIFCLVLAGMMLPCAAEETPQAIVQADKPPIQFKLIRGEQYQLCKDYVDMLNKTQYTEIPVCERTMLPEFKKFRAVQWKEITDKEDVRRLVIEKIRLQGLSGLPGLTNPEQDKMKTIKNIHKAESEMNAGKYHPVYESKIDLDHDGKNEVVYRFESVITPVKKKL